MTRLQAAQAAAADVAASGRYVEELRVRHRIRPAFLRKLDPWSTRAARLSWAEPG
ncbi:MAG TPA: hypothetical protein VI248_08890 [Kineosporiaceae bacterium]